MVLDTSFLVSFYLTQDDNHKNALNMALKNKNESMLLSDIVLFETLTVLNYKGGISLAKEAYDELMRNKQIKFFYFTEIENEEIMDLFFTENKKRKFSFADISVIYLAGKSKSKVLGFDKEINKIVK